MTLSTQSVEPRSIILNAIPNTINSIGRIVFNVEHIFITIPILMWILSIFLYNLQYAVKKSTKVFKMMKLTILEIFGRENRRSIIDEGAFLFEGEKMIPYEKLYFREKYFPIMMILAYNLIKLDFMMAFSSIISVLQVFLLVFLLRFIFNQVKVYRIHTKYQKLEYLRFSTVYIFTLLLTILAGLLFQQRILMMMQLFVIFIPFCDEEIENLTKFYEDPDSFLNKNKDRFRKAIKNGFDEFVSPILQQSSVSQNKNQNTLTLSYEIPKSIVGAEDRLDDLKKKVSNGAGNVYSKTVKTVDEVVESIPDFVDKLF